MRATTGYYKNYVNEDFYLEVIKGNVNGTKIVHKFGSATIGTTLVPVTNDVVFNSPQSAISLELVSENSQDGVGGTGARSITFQGLDANWLEIEQTINTNGLTPVSLPTNLIRLNRWFVATSGTYANQSNGSHAGVLTLRESGAGDTWASIPMTPFPNGQSEMALYTIPKGSTGFILGYHGHVDGNKSADIIMFQRPNADDVAVPYSGAIRIVASEIGVSGEFGLQPKSPSGPFAGPLDIGFMANVSAGTSGIFIDFEILQIEDKFL